MRQIVVEKPGGHAALKVREVPSEPLAPDNIRVEVKAAGINYADVAVRMGLYSAVKKYPAVPGFEFSGIVSEAGSRVVGFKPGDAVLGLTRFGGYSTEVSVAADYLRPMPQGWSFEESAAFPAVFLTAYHGLFRVAKAEAGETVLIHSAAGGVGTALIQLCRIAAIKTVGVVGASHKTAVCEELGCGFVIDKSGSDLWKEARRLAPGGYDVVFDANGVSTLKESYNHLAVGGRLVVYGFASMLSKGKDRPNRIKLVWDYFRTPRFNPLYMTNLNHSVCGFNVVYLFNQKEKMKEAVDRLLGWVSEGRIQKPKVTAFPFEDAARAHEALESGQTAGKLVLKV